MGFLGESSVGCGYANGEFGGDPRGWLDQAAALMVLGVLSDGKAVLSAVDEMVGRRLWSLGMDEGEIEWAMPEGSEVEVKNEGRRTTIYVGGEWKDGVRAEGHWRVVFGLEEYDGVLNRIEADRYYVCVCADETGRKRRVNLVMLFESSDGEYGELRLCLFRVDEELEKCELRLDGFLKKGGWGKWRKRGKGSVGEDGGFDEEELWLMVR